MPPDGLGCGVSPTAVGVASGLIDGTGCAVTAATLGCDPVDAAKTNAATKKLIVRDGSVHGLPFMLTF